MTALTVARYLALLVPVAAVLAAAWHTRPDRRRRGAALIGTVAAGVGILALNMVAGAAGWWRFAAVTGSALGTPADLWLGWALLWGALPALVRVPVPLTLAALGFLDLLIMPRLTALVTLGERWLVGEAIGLAAVALPAILLGRWVADERRLPARATLQLVTFAGLTLWLIPAVAIDLGDGSWSHLAGLPRWGVSLVVQAVALVALPGVLAVREFVERGGGTPYPWDPPRTLVTTGPYAYVANPMQLSGVGLLLVAAAVTHSATLVAAAASTALFAAFIAGPHEHRDLTRRHGAAWAGYRAHVRTWWPRWRPYVEEPARLHLSVTCDMCDATAGAVGALGPRGLTIHPAEEYPRPLRRARYEAPDGYAADGVAAVARGLEHVHLGWAAVGWALRVPVLDRLATLIADGVGAGPRDLPAVRGSGP
ncbi:isoprenylcysteine carboxylmethyltransferase family protein [Luedemannella helvata]|uniref:Isoprenylcysteine carboxylmethyltransferase family protein n=1 Tax=Luedemannella helvata TaxID=349315 RepID=A0ABP4WCD7_9ACTN